MEEKKNKFYILNVAINEYNTEVAFQPGNMYNAYLGDMITVQNYINKLKKHHEISKNNSFEINSVYLTYFPKAGFGSRGNKNILKKFIENIRNEIAEVSKKELTPNCCFVLFIHAHGYGVSDPNGASLIIDVDSNTEGGLEILFYNKIYGWISDILRVADCYIIQNSCFSADDTRYPNTKGRNEGNGIVLKGFDQIYECNSLDTDKKLFVLGMSSRLVFADRYDENSYGIKILKNILDIGFTQNMYQVYSTFRYILNNLNQNSTPKHYLPQLTIFSKNGGDENSDLNAIIKEMELIKPGQEYIQLVDKEFKIIPKEKLLEIWKKNEEGYKNSSNEK